MRIKVKKSNTKSIDAKLESKYDLTGIIPIIAGKDNSGIGRMTTDDNKSYSDKIVIICGGDDGGKTPIIVILSFVPQDL